jgi:hypothetical protein
VTLVKKDTRGIEKDIRSLQERKGLSGTEQEELTRLQSELKRIKDAKEEYLAKNPEHRKFVYPREEEERAEQKGREMAAKDALKRQQPQRDPRRSIYYHEIFNPHGAPPPGMPYMEKSATQWEAEQRKEFDGMVGEGSSDVGGTDSDESDTGSDDIVLPDGPPPLPPANEQSGINRNNDAEEDTSEDEDGIVMPKGPPPGPPSAPRAMLEGIPSGPSAMHQRPPLPLSLNRPPPLPRPMPFRPGQATYRPPLPQRFPNAPMSRTTWSAPPRPNSPPATLPRPPPAAVPSPPSTVITAAPVLRDLKKEATAFVPNALRKKQAATKAKSAKAGLPAAVNAAPRLPDIDGEGE